MSYPLVCSFYTGSHARYVAAFEDSVKALGLPHMVIKMDDRGSWVENCALKPHVILAALRSKRRPILWVDIDAEFKAAPTLLAGPTSFSFAVRAEPGNKTKRPAGSGREISLPKNWPSGQRPCWFNSGTVYVKDDGPGIALVERWCALQKESPRDWDQWTLQQAWADVRPDTRFLPQGYCKIKRFRWAAGEEKRTIIQHEIASSDLKVKRS